MTTKQMPTKASNAYIHINLLLEIQCTLINYIDTFL